MFIQPSTGSCSSTDSIDRGYCSSSGNGLYYHEFLFIQPPTGNCSSKTPSTTLTVHPGKEAAVFDRLQLAAVAKELLGFS